MERSSSKREMREKLLQLRGGLPVFARQEKSREIARRLVDSSEFEAADTIHFYLSNGTEVQTDAIILETLRLKKRVIVPVVHPEDRLLSFSEIAGLNPNQMQTGPFGIRQPRSPFIKEATSRGIDLWIVPGLGFDIQGNRIGYGGGYYDRVLGRVKRKIIGLAFECQVVASIPVGEQDSPVHKIITEQRIINCR